MRDIIKATIAAPMTKLGIRCLVILAVIVVLDQASKAWVLYGLRLAPNMPVTILPFFSFTYVQNTGMSF
ncbi:MAG: signal peptidase II, partial [Asticcacaulis sp.]|nr:signal peptidase II [Asticcacaulis sp.]